MEGTETTPDASAGRDDPEDLPAGEVRELFLALTKAVRAVQLYDRDNPIYQRFVSQLREAFSGLWEGLDGLEILVEEGRLLCQGEEVYRNEDQAESLAFLFYRDGIRAFTISPGFEEGELESFLGAIHRGRHVQRTQDDLITLLWSLDLQHFDYSYVDFLAESVELPEGGGGQQDLKPVFQEEVGAAAEADAPAAGPAAPPVVNREDFNPTLYSLEPAEVETLRRELRREMERDLRQDVLHALFDRLEEPERPERQQEIADILGMVLPNFLARGELTPAARVLAEVRNMRGKEGPLPQGVRTRVDQVLEEVSSPEAIDQLVRALESGALGVDSEALGDFLRQLQPRALEPLTRAATTLDREGRAAPLREALDVLGAEHPATVVSLLSSPDPTVAAGAARLVGRLRIEDGGPDLADLVDHDDPEVRRAVAEAAASLAASVVLEAVVDLLTDPVREVRLAAARTLGRTRYRPAAQEFRELLHGRALRRADITEQSTFFESYGRLGDPEAVPFLDRLLNGRGRFLRKESPEIRASAALALGKVGTPEARASLEKVQEQEEAVIRNAVRRALRGEED